MQKLQPAELPPVFMNRLMAAAESTARPRREVPLPKPSLWELCWPVLRWLMPTAAVVGAVIFIATRSVIAPKAPLVLETGHSPMKADDVQLARKFVGAFDAVAELPGGETVRFRCNEWTDQMTLRDANHGIEVVQRTPSFEVIPVRFETY